MKYEFVDNVGRITESEQNNFEAAQNYAEKHGLTCLTMTYDVFVKSFMAKITQLENHAQYEVLAKCADRMIAMNQSFGYGAIAANVFMKRIIRTPISEIEAWLEGDVLLDNEKNTLKSQTVKPKKKEKRKVINNV